MSIDTKQLLEYIIRPTLKQIGLHSDLAEKLVLGTACQESQCGRWLMQINGRAIGIFQMEPDTYDDIWLNCLAYNPALGAAIKKLSFGLVLNNASEMAGNLYLATAMCRVHYWRVDESIPESLPAQAAFWKTHYNTPSGAGDEQDYIMNWRRYAGAEIWQI